jgi:hypothetical protein
MDVDTGTDDAVAIMLAALHRGLDLVAVTHDHQPNRDFRRRLKEISQIWVVWGKAIALSRCHCSYGFPPRSLRYFSGATSLRDVTIPGRFGRKAGRDEVDERAHFCRRLAVG